MLGSWETEMFFHGGKMVLPGTGCLEQETGISVDIISRVTIPPITN